MTLMKLCFRILIQVLTVDDSFSEEVKTHSQPVEDPFFMSLQQ